MQSAGPGSGGQWGGGSFGWTEFWLTLIMYASPFGFFFGILIWAAKIAETY